MFDAATLAVYLTAAVALILTPGPDTAYVLARGAGEGRRAGVLSALGVSTGILVHTAAAAFGLATKGQVTIVGVMIAAALLPTAATAGIALAWGLPVAAALTHGMSLAAGESPASVAWTPAALLALGYVSIFAGVAAYIAYFGLIDATGAIKANLVFYVVPVVATLGGWALLGETISGLAVAGFLVIFAGFVVLGSESLDLPGVARSGVRAVQSRAGAVRRGVGLPTDGTGTQTTLTDGGSEDRDTAADEGCYCPGD